MKLSFRQGLVSYQTSGGNPDFLQVSGSNVYLKTNSAPVVVTFAYGEADYLHSEVLNLSTTGWTGLDSSTRYLFWDINSTTGARTFGSTLLVPVFQATPPSSPSVDQHWFDTSDFVMKVWTGTNWTVKVRVFAARLNSGTTITYMWTVGSQVGISGPVRDHGRIVYNSDGKGIKNGTRFLTSTDRVFLSSVVNGLSLEYPYITAQATETIPANSVVKLSGFGQMALADYSDVGTSTIGFVEQSVTNGQTGNLVLQGYLINPSWNWSTLGSLWVGTGGSKGTLVSTDPGTTTRSVPVAKVVTTSSVFFQQGLGTQGERGQASTFDIKESVRAATTANINLAAAPTTIDSVSLATNDRVLVKNQSTGSQNGIYYVKTLGTGSNGVWVRTMDADENVEVTSGTMCFVEEGTTNGNQLWFLSTDNPITVGATVLTFQLFSIGSVVGGNGILNTGGTLSVVTANPTNIAVSGGGINLGTTGVGAGTYKSVTVDVYGRVTGATNPTTLSGYGITDAVNKGGDTMTGALTLSGTPTLNLHAATKLYVDTAYAGGTGISLSGTTINLNAGITTLTDVTTTTPISGQALVYNGSQWVNDVVVGGLTTTNTASTGIDLTLTSLSASIQGINATAPGVNLVLPDATTLVVRSPRYLIYNTGSTNSFVIKNSAGTALFTLLPGHVVNISLVDKSTPAGSWVFLEGRTSTPEVVAVAISDEVSPITTGVAKVTFRMSYDFFLTSVRASLTTAQASGSLVTVDINENGSSVLSTKLTIDNTEKTSTTAATAPVFSDTFLADDSEITVDVDVVGDGTAKGLKVYLLGLRK